jgi:endonuclease-3
MAARRTMTKAEVRAFMEALARARPDPQTELAYTDAYTLLVAVALSAQATDASVNKATATLFAVAPDPAAMVALGVDGVGQHIRTVGLWQGKARRVIEMSDILLRDFGGVVPAEREALEALPGVGRKTANVVLNVAFGQDTLAVDTHVFRVANRTGMAMGETPREVEDGLVARIPRALLHHAHHWIILHGRYVCVARRPECWRCVGVQWCRFPEKVLVAPAVKKGKSSFL